MTMDAMVENFIDMENLIQKNLLSPSEKLNQFATNNPVQRTLRQQIEELNTEMIQMREDNKNMNAKLYQNKDNDNKNHLDQ